MYVCILALHTQHAMRMRRIILPSVACLALTYLSTLSSKLKDFRKKINETICTCLDFFHKFFLTFLILEEFTEVH
jgi:hypothetical protein